MTPEDIYPRMVKVLEKVFGPISDLNPDTDLWKLAPDSLEMQALSLEMIEEFDCQGPWSEIATGKVRTVQDAVNFTYEHLKDKQ